MIYVEFFFLQLETQSSPYINRFVQPDSIIPNPSNPQTWNRYSYVTNRPVNFNDPTGHKPVCEDDEDCHAAYTIKDQINDLKLGIKNKFKWNIKGDDWTLDELRAIYQTGSDIENYINGLTNGNGNAWVKKNLGNTNFVHADWGDSHAETWPKLFGGATINFGKTWLKDSVWTPNETVSHELGHVWDIHTGFAASAELMWDLGGQGVPYFGNPKHVPQWDPQIHPYKGDAYGNSRRNDYFAEAFSMTIYNPANTPSGVSAWIDDKISNPASLPPDYQPWG